MNILTYFTENSIPKIGLSPTIRIRNSSTGILIITDELMSEVGDGFYKYDFMGYDSSIDYAIRCDGGVILSNDERYSYAGNDVDQTGEIWSNTIRTLTSGTKDAEIDAIKERTENLPDDPASESGALAKENSLTTLAQDATVAKETTLNTKASQASIDAIKTETDKIKFILGLSQENYKLFDIVYSGDLITSTTIKTYPTSDDCENNTNPLATYSVVATYDVDGKLLTYKVKKV